VTPVPRRTAKLVWAALLLLPLVFTAVALAVARGAALQHLATPLLWAALGFSAVDVVLSRVLPTRLGERAGTDGRDAMAFSRFLVALALCEAAAFAPLVAYMLTADVRLLAVLAVDLVALAALFPSDGRWRALAAAGAAPRRAH
jgi:hypothetical protein